MSVDDIDPPGCPDFALHTILRMSRRTCVEISWSCLLSYISEVTYDFGIMQI